MFGIGDYVKCKITGECGVVIGFGHEIECGAYLTTLKVRLVGKRGNSSSFVERVLSAWEKSEWKTSVEGELY